MVDLSEEWWVEALKSPPAQDAGSDAGSAAVRPYGPPAPVRNAAFSEPVLDEIDLTDEETEPTDDDLVEEDAGAGDPVVIEDGRDETPVAVGVPSTPWIPPHSEYSPSSTTSRLRPTPSTSGASAIPMPLPAHHGAPAAGRPRVISIGRLFVAMALTALVVSAAMGALWYREHRQVVSAQRRASAAAAATQKVKNACRPAQNDFARSITAMTAYVNATKTLVADLRARASSARIRQDADRVSSASRELSKTLSTPNAKACAAALN